MRAATIGKLARTADRRPVEGPVHPLSAIMSVSKIRQSSWRSKTNRDVSMCLGDQLPQLISKLLGLLSSEVAIRLGEASLAV